MRIHPKSPRTVLQFETLEDRTVPSAVSTFATDRLLVTFADVAPDMKAVAQIGVPTLAKSVTSLGLGIYRVDLATGVDFQKAITIFSARPDVQSVARDSIVSVAQTPNDPQLGSQWNLSKIGAAQGWNATTGTGQTIVAVIDTGVDYTHPDLAANIWTNTLDPATGGLHGYDFSANDTNPMDETGHGTHVAGIIGATGNNGVGVTGVDQHAKIMALRFMDANGNGYTSDAVRAIDYAIRHGAKILNNSWDGSAPDPTLAAAIERARAAGVIVVVAAGNETANNDTTASYPATYARQSDNVVVVASTNSSDGLSSFSNYGVQTVKIAAPGESILSTALGGGYITKTGTSMATPVISGALALLWDLHPTWSYSQVLAKLTTSVDTVGGLSGKVTTAGRINLAKLLDASATAPPVTTPPVTVPPVTSPPPAPSTPALRWDGGGPKVTSAVFRGATTTSFNTVRVTFDKKMNAPTFTPSDVVLTGPNGKITVTAVTAVANSNNSVFDITFATQATAGTYTVSIGPDMCGPRTGCAPCAFTCLPVSATIAP
jgi:subtilisin family serine protease